jgi:hypothetical protein
MLNTTGYAALFHAEVSNATVELESWIAVSGMKDLSARAFVGLLA